MNRRYISRLRMAYHNPDMIRDKISEIIDPLRRAIFIKRYGNMVDIMKKDWDNLIILDACKYSTFLENNTIDGTLTKVISKGSHSNEFIKHNFLGKDLSDTIYITANPNAEIIEEDVFYKIKKTYTEKNLEKQLDYSGVSPEKIIETVIQTLNEHPDKRIIVHFMQPHSPYLGEYATDLRKKLYDEESISFLRTHDKESFFEATESLVDLRDAESNDYIERSQLIKAYKENLNFVLEYVSKLLQQISGKSVITSDHGELLGKTDSFIYNNLPSTNMHGHPSYTYLPELRFVPWLEVDGYENRRDVIKEEPLEDDNIEQSAIDEQLRALGYKT